MSNITVEPRAEAAPQTAVEGVAAPAEALTEAPKTESRDEMLSPKFAALARREKALRQQQLDIQRQKDALKTEEESFKSKYAMDYISKSRVQEDPLSVLEEQGITYDRLVEMALEKSNGQNTSEVRALKAKQIEIENKINQVADQFTSSQNKQYEQAIAGMKQDAKALVETDPAYETIKESGSSEAIVELITATWNEEGKMLSIAEAAKEVENYLLDEAVKVAGYKRVQERLREKLAPVSDQTEAKLPAETRKSIEVVPRAAQQPRPQIKTITNAQTTAITKPRTEAERRIRAIARARGEL